MKYLIQHTNEVEEFLIIEKLKEQHLDYEVVDKPAYIEDYIPVGTIEFVQECTGKIIKPIEIPYFLQSPYILRREYKIVDYNNLLVSGEYFIKDVSKIKEFANIINFANISKEELDIDKSHLFSVSEIFDIKAEYRVNVIHNKIDSITNYAGDVTIFPDISTINTIKNLIFLNMPLLNSYTMDLMVGPKGTALIEIHNFVAVGLYSTLNGDLPLAYREGISFLRYDSNSWKLF